MTESIFTKIINGQIPCHKLYEDDLVIAFLDINPVRTGHTLIVPKIQIDYFTDVPENYYQAVFSLAQRLAPAIEKALGLLHLFSLSNQAQLFCKDKLILSPRQQLTDYWVVWS